MKPNSLGRRALAIVAHPDDETIWLGGLIARRPEMNWTIFSLCRASDPDRAPKFFRVCRHFKAKALIADLPDDGGLSVKQLTPLIKKIIIKQLSRADEFAAVFTHGANGEYGHPVHRAAHQAVKSLYKAGRLKTSVLLCFNYKKSARPAAKTDSDLIIRLCAREFKNKKAVMTEIYGFEPDGVDANYCTNPEAFKIINL